MDLTIKHDINNNIFSTAITISGFGTEELSEVEEKAIIENFPTKIAYRSLKFSGNIKIDGTVPVVTDEEVSEGNIVTVTLPALSNREISIDENFEAVYKIDTAKISQSAIDPSVLTSKELVAQAYCAIFDDAIMNAVKESIESIRQKAPMFEGENIVSV